MPHLYKQDNGNLRFFAATTQEEEKLARAAGFMLLEELFPTEKAKQDALTFRKPKK